MTGPRAAAVVYHDLATRTLRVYGIGMHFVKEQVNNAYVVRAYTPGQVTIGNADYHRSLILTPDRLIDDWRPQQHAELGLEDFQAILDMQPEIVLLGTGTGLHFPAPALMATLLGAGIGLEVMDTAAACRTFNILLGEDRNVVAALLLG